ncbi:MAG TPA: hypothetical protein VGR63_15400 [Casimicrobiaceae bacterium]|jgi:hypothetical protein|nr:hypothetical protein [Casimicrobiaceae bacterium]
MTYETAAQFLARHHIPARPSAQPGHIEALAGYGCDGTGFFVWETVPMTLGAIRDWLGY